MMVGSEEKKNKRIAFLVSVGLHACLFLTFFFLISWRAPYPPAPEYGVELNFGLDDQGGGEIQPDVPVGNPLGDDAEKELKSSEETTTTPDLTDEKIQKDESAEVKTDGKIISDEESPVEVKIKAEKKAEEKPKTRPEVKQEKNIEAKQEVKKEATYTGNTNSKKGETQQSQGDDNGKTGDKGNPQGKLDAKALYGKPGGGGGGDGFGLAMSGWEWASTPSTPNLPDNEDGRIVFEIECDANGEIVGINTLERGLSPKAEQLLKDEIRKNSLIRTTQGKTPPKSKGKVIFVLKTK
ncbi:MAG: cell envelope integrity protein TolA [Bacteroidetes bacterium]|nr:cell envelope integrity protein TolA [Bacteroidota bacterium]